MDPVEAFKQANALVAPLYAPGSRYYGIPAARLSEPGEPPIAYLRRRFVPPPENFALLQEHAVVALDRIDNIAARYLGDPLQYWRTCDANRAMRPDDLTRTPGGHLRITLPEGIPGDADAV